MDVNKELKIDTSCYHCGDPIEDTSYQLDSHRFCCLGCQTVYQILNENNMASYYRYNSHPGKSQKIQKEDLAYLDEPNIIAKLVDYQDEELYHHHLLRSCHPLQFLYLALGKPV